MKAPETPADYKLLIRELLAALDAYQSFKLTDAASLEEHGRLRLAWLAEVEKARHASKGR